MTENNLDFILKRGVAEIIIEAELRQRLGEGKPLPLKEGFDPSFPTSTWGIPSPCANCDSYRNWGHQVVLIVGTGPPRLATPAVPRKPARC